MIEYTFKREPDEGIVYLRVRLEDKEQLAEEWQARAVTVYKDEYLSACMRNYPDDFQPQKLGLTGFIEDPEIFRTVMRERREALKLSKLAMAQMIGISNVAYAKIESGESVGMPETLQKICYALRIRYNFLPYEGRPQQFFVKIREHDRYWSNDVRTRAQVRKKLWEMVLSRILTLGFHLSQTQELLGVSYSDLRQMILFENELPETFRQTLQEKLRLRVLPAPRKFTDQNEFVNWVGQLSDEWQMTLRDWEKFTGMSIGNCKDFLDGKHGPDSKTSSMMADGLGVSLEVDALAALAKHETRFVHDAALILAMESQRQKAGLSLHGLAVRAGVDPDVFNMVFIRLLVAAKSHSMDTLILDFSGISTTRHQSREMLKEVCRILKIDLMEKDVLDRESVSVTKGVIEDWGGVVAAFVKRRKMLLVSQKEFVRIYRESTGDSLSINSLVALERGEIKASLIPVARKIAGFLQVDIVEVDALKPEKNPATDSLTSLVVGSTEVPVIQSPEILSPKRRRAIYEVGEMVTRTALHQLAPQFYNLWLLIHMQNRAKVLQTQPSQILANRNLSASSIVMVRNLFERFSGDPYPDKPSPLVLLLSQFIPVPQELEAEDAWYKNMREIFSVIAHELEVSFHQLGSLPFHRVVFDCSASANYGGDFDAYSQKIQKVIVWRRLCLMLSRIELAGLSGVDVDDLIFLESRNLSYRELMQKEREIFSVSHVLGLSLDRIPDQVHSHFNQRGTPPASSHNSPHRAPSGTMSGGPGRGTQNKASGAAKVVPQGVPMGAGIFQMPGLFRPFGSMGRFR